MDLFLQLSVVFGCLFLGARSGDIALGLFSGIGIVIFVFIFKLAPGKPPVDVMLTIIAVVVASATLQASGGLEVMLKGTEKLLRQNPRYVTIMAPFTTCTLTIACGTGHVVYTMLPIIYDIAVKNGVRPERPIAGAIIASQMGIIASPVSVAIASLVAFLASESGGNNQIDFFAVLSITIPATIAGVLMVGIYSWSRGRELEKDKAFQELISDPEGYKRVYGDNLTLIGKKLSMRQWAAMYIFIGAVVMVSLLGSVETLRPTVNAQPLSMVLTIQMVMLFAAALIILVTDTKPASISQSEIFRAGMVAVVTVFGIAWMSSTVFEANLKDVELGLTELVKAKPWFYAIALLVVSTLVNSQAATISALVPVALSVGVPIGYIIAFAGAAYGYFILPTYPSYPAAVQFDRSGTTRIGNYVFNHSFIMPGLIGVSTSCCVGYLLAIMHGLFD
ncbi:MAG: anaerobic C4-dicarboxylate transporter [Nitrosospira sp.]